MPPCLAGAPLVKSNRSLSWLAIGVLSFGGCGDGTGPQPEPVVDCSQVTPTSLAVGEQALVDAAQIACVRLPAAGAGGAEYLSVALAAEGREMPDGVLAGYSLVEVPAPVAAASARPSQSRRRGRGPTPASEFHASLRARERALSADLGAASFARSRIRPAASAPPTVGEQRTFKVCATPECAEFVDATATARVVAQRVAIFLDDAAPAGGYTQTDLQAVGQLFDDHLYPIDTTAFGHESDLDANDVLIVLLTQRVNQLSPTCNDDGSVILGYFFGLDLLPSLPNSNNGEIFYGLVPDPDNPACDISPEFARDFLPPVFIHEFQHMISFNEHVLERGTTAEDTWLNEGLSHFAEELGGRLVPDTECQPAFASCEDQFIGEGNIVNAYEYLDDPESSFLIEPGSSPGDLPERGANWLFVRWLADHFATTQPQGTDLTRALVQTNLLGSANVTAAVGRPFPDLLSDWQLANFLDDSPGFSSLNGRTQYTSWNFRDIFQTNFDNNVPGFEKPYPLTPDTVLAGDGLDYQRQGMLRGGSGPHVLVVQPPDAGPVDLLLTGEDGSTVLPASVLPRVVVIRIR